MGGLNGFIHSFIAEVMAICRAHVAALGGNALVSYQMSECVLEDNIQKNQVPVSLYQKFNVKKSNCFCSLYQVDKISKDP